MNDLKIKLEKDNWFVTEKITFVSPDAFNCATSSNIRFFKSEDQSLADKLKENLKQLPESLGTLKGNLEVINLINLANWSKASLVPDNQLEFWVIDKGAQCSKS